MIHIFIINGFLSVMGLAGRFSHRKLSATVMENGHLVKVLSGPGLVPDALTIVCFGLVIACSWPTYRFIEIPFRDMSRDLAKRVGRKDDGLGLRQNP